MRAWLFGGGVCGGGGGDGGMCVVARLPYVLLRARMHVRVQLASVSDTGAPGTSAVRGRAGSTAPSSSFQ